MLVEQNSHIIKRASEDIVLSVSKIDRLIINFFLNTPSTTYLFSSLLRRIRERINVIIIFSIAFILSIVFHVFNLNHRNILIDYIAQNLWCQTVIIFLTISSFINIFYPFTLHKEIDKKDIESISKGIAENEIVEREKKKERERTASL